MPSTKVPRSRTRGLSRCWREKCEQLLGQACAPRRGSHQRLEPSIVIPQLILQQLGTQENRGKYIVEFMRYAAGELINHIQVFHVMSALLDRRRVRVFATRDLRRILAGDRVAFR